MIQLLLFLAVMFPTTAFAGDHINEIMCREVASVLREAVRDGYIKEQEADRIMSRCSLNQKP